MKPSVKEGRILRNVFAAALAVILCGPSTAAWKEVVPPPDAAYVEWDAVVRRGSAIEYLLLVNDRNGEGYRSLVYRIRIDCGRGTDRNLDTTYYSRPYGEGNVVERLNGGRPETYIRRGSVSHEVMQTFC